MRFFEGLKVVDLTQVWIGPMMTRILNDLGANVIKIERTDRPDGRVAFLAGNDASGEFWNNRTQYFAARNAGKRAMQLDLRSEQGREILMQAARGRRHPGGELHARARSGAWASATTT